MPKPLLSKLVAQAAIGFFCVLFGCIIGLQTKDKILLIMSLVIGACCLIRCISLHHLIHSGSYLTVEGYCSKREVSAFKKTQQIHLIRSDGREYQFTMQTATFGGHQSYIRRSARDPSPAANRYAAKGSLHE